MPPSDGGSTAKRLMRAQQRHTAMKGLQHMKRHQDTTTHHSAGVLLAKTQPSDSSPAFVSLDAETRTAVDTATAAFHLSRRPQTLRGWACREDGPLRAVRLHGRLAWKTDDLRRLWGVAK